jgi:hypothetical protein
MRVASNSRVKLPGGVLASYEVYVNGVRQQEGADFVRQGDELVFRRPMAKEGRLGFWRWLSLFLGIAGTYRQNDSVDVVYDVDGRRVVATGLPITRDETGQRPDAHDTAGTEEDRPA